MMARIPKRGEVSNGRASGRTPKEFERRSKTCGLFMRHSGMGVVFGMIAAVGLCISMNAVGQAHGTGTGFSGAHSVGYPAVVGVPNSLGNATQARHGWLALLVSWSDELGENAVVVGRFLFYNNSLFDGFNGGADAMDDNALAIDKVPLLPAGVGVYANYSSYSLGINGVFVDVSGLAGVPTVEDFTFRVGNIQNLDAWSAAPDPSILTLRNGAGGGGSVRITLIWPDNSIENKWLEVTLKSTERTGLAADNTFYFGNTIGQTGDGTQPLVNAIDLLRIRSNFSSVFDPLVPITSLFDIDRDGRVNAIDFLRARSNPTTPIDGSMLILLQAPPP